MRSTFSGPTFPATASCRSKRRPPSPRSTTSPSRRSTAGGPIATAAAIHLAAALPNSFITEAPFPVDDADRRMREEIGGAALEKPDEGFFALPEAPGLGIDISESVIRKYAA